jgi:hypothetical protein
VQVHRSEGVANHTGPESCVDDPRGRGEALTGDCIGQPSSREREVVSGADVLAWTEGNMDGCDIASIPPTRRGRRPWHVQTLLVREPGELMTGQGGLPPLVRVGKVRSQSRR